MTAVYWPPDEYDCTPQSRAIEHPSTVHSHHDSERAACEALLWLLDNYNALHERGERYHCVRGPGGLLRDVKQ